MSKGEDKVAALLSGLSIPFIREYQFLNLRGIRGRAYRFDFAIIDPFKEVAYIIEVNGEQHYQPIDHFGGEKAFIATKFRDNRKIMYCKEHDIPLIVIPYGVLDNLKKEDVILSSKYRIF